MKKAASKKMTIDDLVVMVAKGFDGVHKEMNERFNEVNKRFDKVENRLGKVEENLAATRMDVLGLGDRYVSRFEFNQHLARIDRLEQKVKTKK